MLTKTMRMLALAVGLAIPGSLQAQTVTLKISHYLPPSHGFQADFLEPWAKELEQRTGGKVKAEIFAAGSAYGEATRQADQVKAGVVDIALGLAGIPRGRFPATSVIELPFLVDNAGPGSKALWQLYKDGALGKEYDDFKVLALFVHHGGLFHTVNRPVRSPEDLKGLRMRTPGLAVSVMLKALGASPVARPPAQIYESLERGVLDGVVTTWDLVGALKLNETLKYHTDARAYAAAFYVVMNKQTYASLPEEARKAIDEISGDALVAKFGPWWDKWEARGKEDAVQRKQEIVVLDDDARAAWAKQLEPMIGDYLDELSGQGVADPKALYRKTKELITRFSGK